ncbi:hypothetical protein [Pseudomonas sp. CJQ_13]|uniref:hypothetical protein n=1 Tax=Pseudomonas sp. CJQ_13 TaxID=3367170 RepID=UPI003709C82B
MNLFIAIRNFIIRDKRPKKLVDDEQAFIAAVNSLKSLKTTERGGMSIDPEEIREQIIKARATYKDFVDPNHRRPPTPR